MTSDITFNPDPVVKYANRTARLKKFIELNVPAPVVADECVLVMLAVAQIKHNEHDPMVAFDKMIEDLKKTRMEWTTAINEEAEPM